MSDTMQTPAGQRIRCDMCFRWYPEGPSHPALDPRYTHWYCGPCAGRRMEAHHAITNLCGHYMEAMLWADRERIRHQALDIVESSAIPPHERESRTAGINAW